MRTGFSVHTGGLCLSVDAPDEELLEQVAGAICIPGWRRSLWQPGDIDVRVSWFEDRVCVRVTDFASGDNLKWEQSAACVDDLLGALEQFCHHELATRASDVYVHAGVVGIRGRALVIPGRSWSGKSTLVMALVNAGADYYSDEFAVLSPDGSLTPFARPLNLRYPAARRVVVARDFPPPLPKLQVAQLHYDSVAGWKVTPLSPGNAVLALLDNTVAARRLGSSASATFARALWGGVHWSGSRGDADEAASRLLRF
jgi:hypothetical protein